MDEITACEQVPHSDVMIAITECPFAILPGFTPIDTAECNKKTFASKVFSPGISFLCCCVLVHKQIKNKKQTTCDICKKTVPQCSYSKQVDERVPAQESATKSLAPGNGNKEPGTRNHEPGATSRELGPGPRPELGPRKLSAASRSRSL